MISDIDICVTLLDNLDKVTWHYLQTHANYIESIEGWMWDSNSQCIEIYYTGVAWEARTLTVSLKDLLEWADEHVK